jgi:hypothetical protein
LATNPRILLVEHLDAVGSSLTDLKPRARVLREMGFDVRMAALAAGGDGDLQHGSAERRQSGIERYDEQRDSELVRRAAESFGADAIVWASCSAGGGEAARTLGQGTPAWWWPSGWTPVRGAGPLPRLAPELDPGDACVVDGERPKSARLSLWDGPYALLASPLKPADAELLFDGFAKATDQRDELDLVVLDHPDPGLEAAARAARVAQRVHFVGPAPREAEQAWLQHARVTFVGLHRPLAAGLVVRALGVGCPLLAVGLAAEPVRAWLAAQALTWGKPERGRLVPETIAAALSRTPAVETAVARGRACAADGSGSSLVARFAPMLGALSARRERAA